MSYIPNLGRYSEPHNNPNLAVQIDRRKQINTLRIFNENVIEAQPDVEYRMAFGSSPNGQDGRLILVITLPRGFPQKEKPVIKLFAAAPDESASNDPDNSIALRHPWLNQESIVTGSPGLNNFGPHSDLGRVAQAIKREFERNPPVRNRNENSISSSQKPVPNHVLNSKEPTPQLGDNQQQSVSLVKTTSSTTASISELESMSLAELTELKEDPVALQSFCQKQIRDHNLFADHERQSKSLTKDISSTVEASYELRERIESKQKEVEAKIQQHSSMKEDVRQVRDSLSALRGQSSTSEVRDNLKQSSFQLETESEKMADQFLSKKMPLEDFLSSYLEARTQYHLKKAKSDRVAS